MKKIVYYHENACVAEVDFSRPWLDNPGVGGTEYNFMVLIYHLQSYLKNHCLDREYQFILLTNEITKLPKGTIAYSVKSGEEAISKTKQLNADIFVAQPSFYDSSSFKTWQSMQSYADSGIKFIARSHGFLQNSTLDLLHVNNNIKAFVCVGHEQLDSNIYHSIYDKSTFIFNIFESELAQPIPFEKRSTCDVVYLGSLIDAKGFHVLAEAWPKVLKKVPDARLKVIGSGKLYDRNNSLGRYGIASEDYEKRFMPFLTDDKGAIIPSVEFFGTMGTEKYEVMKKAAVGVVNPTSWSETFCMSAVQFQACGVPVVAGNKFGLLDTVEHGKTGLLVKDVDTLSVALIQLLNNPEQRSRMGAAGPSFVRNKFNKEATCEKWIELFETVLSGRSIGSIRPRPKSQFWRDKKIFRHGNWYLRKLKAFFRSIPRLFSRE